MCLFMVYSRTKYDDLKMYIFKIPLNSAASMWCFVLGVEHAHAILVFSFWDHLGVHTHADREPVIRPTISSNPMVRAAIVSLCWA